MVSQRNSPNFIEINNICKKLRDGFTVSRISSMFNVSRSTVYAIKRSEKFRLHKGSTDDEVKCNSKKKRLLANRAVNECLWNWYKSISGNNVPINGGVMKMKAKELASKLAVSDFSASDVWLQNFKTKHGIVFKKLSRFGGDAVQENISCTVRSGTTAEQDALNKVICIN